MKSTLGEEFHESPFQHQPDGPGQVEQNSLEIIKGITVKRIDVDVVIKHLDISFLKRLTGTLF